ncbi:MAG TPA: DUF2252 family protein, partial [Jatrophihabitans sp.]|nr:DUF2252 family protein [Jatrophihabitans sp.]
VAAKARGRDRMQAFDKLTTMVDGHRRIVPDPPLVVPISDLLPEVARGELESAVRVLLTRYGHTLASDRQMLLHSYEFIDMARKVVGVGSVGTRCWIVLLRGRDDNDPLFLQIKEAQRSVVAEYGSADPAEPGYASEGERVVAGQRLMQAASDIFLGWETIEGIDGQVRDFYVRQLRDWKGSFAVESAVPSGLCLYGEICGWTLARAHARSADRIAIAAYLADEAGDFARAIARFAEAYADQNERDHAALAEAIRTGRLSAAAVP